MTVGEDKVILRGSPRTGVPLPPTCWFVARELRPDGSLYWLGIYSQPGLTPAEFDGDTRGYSVVERHQISRGFFQALLQEYH